MFYFLFRSLFRQVSFFVVAVRLKTKQHKLSKYCTEVTPNTKHTQCYLIMTFCDRKLLYHSVTSQHSNNRTIESVIWLCRKMCFMTISFFFSSFTSFCSCISFVVAAAAFVVASISLLFGCHPNHYIQYTHYMNTYIFNPFMYGLK